jgi:hypothetical protein
MDNMSRKHKIMIHLISNTSRTMLNGTTINAPLKEIFLIHLYTQKRLTFF